MLLDLLNLIKFTYEGSKKDGALELRVEEQTKEVERIIKPSNVSQDTSDGIDVSLVYIILAIKFEELVEVDTRPWSFIVIS